MNSKERLVPGDRLLWMHESEDGNFNSVLFESFSYCQVVARTHQPIDGIPLSMNLITVKPTPAMIKASNDVLSLGIPRTWAPRNPDVLSGWSEVAQKKAPPEYWLQQLSKRK
jgi:hypothetical protein